MTMEVETVVMYQGKLEPPQMLEEVRNPFSSRTTSETDFILLFSRTVRK